MVEKRGMALARAWAEAYGTAWVGSVDLLEGPWAGQATFQQALRALKRSHISYERAEQDGRSFLYRLDPGFVVGLLEKR